jgi:hypothetical protein
MRKVTLYNKQGQQLTEININAAENEIVDGIQWGCLIFIWDDKLLHFRESTIKPGIFKKGGKKNV